jgi:hypothetical protein
MQIFVKTLVGKTTTLDVDQTDLAAAAFSKGVAPYIKQIMCKLKAGQLNLEGRPWVQPPEPHREAVRINAMRSAANTFPNRGDSSMICRTLPDTRTDFNDK